MGIRDLKTKIVLENKYVKIEISKNDASVIAVTDVRSGESVIGDSVRFFELYKCADTKVLDTVQISALEYADGVISVVTALGKIDVRVDMLDDWYSLEVLGAIPEGASRFEFGHVKFDYDLNDPSALRATGIAMTVNGNPCFFPSGYNREIRGECFEHLGGATGAKIGYAIVPETILRETLKKVCSCIDPDKGIVSKSAGPWARDSRMSFGDYMIVFRSEKDYIENNMEFFKQVGVDQLDFHKGQGNFRQGDFKYSHYKDDADWKANVTDKIAKYGMDAGLHTYAYYIDPACNEILSDPKWQQQLDREEVFTLAEDVSADADFFPTVESTADLSDYYGFFTRNLPYFLIGEEIVQYTNHPQGFKTCIRGIGGSKPVPHKKGEKMYHLIGCFNLFSPKPSTDLYKLIAHNTANTYNNGGFKMIYLDALDGIGRHCKGWEAWYHCAVFVHEIVKNCGIAPIIEYSTMYPSIWAARARMGATDTPYRAYKYFNEAHHRAHITATRQHFACTLGWYNYFPTTDNQPGNYHTKYHHWDQIDHMGALSVAYDYSTVFNGLSSSVYDRYEGYRRNILRYRKYSELRKSFYFSDDILAKARANPHELAIIEKERGKYFFVEKNYEVKRLYDIEDEKRNTEVFENPFKRQTPFIRIEANMSTLGQDPMILLPLDETKPVSDQLKTHEFGAELDLNRNLAMTVRVKGNGKKGAIGIKTRCASNSEFGYGLYIIETDFEGWRDFVLCEADNGDRPDLGFDQNEHFYPIYRSGLQTGRMVKVELESKGDVGGVLMSSVKACRQVYNVIKNPTVTIGKETVKFECELMSTDFIEWDGKEAKVIDRYANEKKIWFEGSVTAPKGKYKATVGATSLNGCPMNVHLTIGTTGNVVK